MKQETIGILGGMGPEATALLFKYIIDNTQAGTDQEHIHLIIDSNTNIPDRSGHLLFGGEDPVPEMVRSARRLQEAGAGFILIPCNTAHFFLDRLQENINLPVLHMIETTAAYVAGLPAGERACGLLATLGTYHTGLYEKYFMHKSLQLVVPEEADRLTTMESIYGKEGIKSGYKEIPLGLLQPVLERLYHQGIKGIVSGCTELSVLFEEFILPVRHINPLEILARTAILHAGYRLKS